MGTSPRTRGKQITIGPLCAASGNIPAHAGKTMSMGITILLPEEHPRARGENIIGVKSSSSSSGTSPRTRGKPLGVHDWGIRRRNIPAHAGKTVQGVYHHWWGREHPRARGENTLEENKMVLDSGTSPRTRGKPTITSFGEIWHRNIPAHAGKTFTRRGYRLYF